MEFYIERFRTELRLFDDNSDLEFYSNWWMPFLKSSRAVILNKNGDKLYSIKRNFLLSKFKLVYEIHRANGFKYKEIVFLLITCLNIGNENESEMSFDFGNIGKVEALDNNWKPN